MNKYRIGNEIAIGVNLESAASSLGYTGIKIFPLWRGTSNRKYKIHCDQESILFCEWI